MRRRLRGQHQGPKVARHHSPRAADPGESGPPRRGRRRPAGRRRRRLPDPDAGRAAARLGRRARADAAAARPLCRGHVLPAADEQARAITPSSMFEHYIAAEGQTLVGWRDVPTDTTGLGKTRDRDDAGDPPGDRRRQPVDPRPGRVRAQDPDDPQADPEQRPRAGGEARHCRGSATSTCRPSPPGRWSTRACCWRRRSAASTTTCAIR